MRASRLARCLTLLSGLAIGAGPAFGDTTYRADRLGDALHWAVPAAAAAYALHEDDRDGLKELGLSWGAAQLAAEGLKRSIHDARPNGTGLGAVSGHAASAFAAAGFLHRRYGLAPAAPAYALATLTAYSRVHTGHHHARQVLAGAALGEASAWLLTRPLANGGFVSVLPTDTGGAAVVLQMPWN